MKREIVALVAGVLFGLGLAVSQMINPEKVLGFLDIAGAWDPSLALVMGGALAVATIGTLIMRRTQRPVLDVRYYVPDRRDLDARLIAGAALFGMGWGIGGYCPGPGLAAMTIGWWEPFVFVFALIAGSLTWKFIGENG